MEGDRVKSQSLKGPGWSKVKQTGVWAEPLRTPGSSAPPTKIAWSLGIQSFLFVLFFLKETRNVDFY